jgi:3-phenylpropionate/trans-cinnamate dioxygenase ferredoxin subunit
MAEFEQVARVDEIVDGGRKSLIVDDVPVLLLRVGDDFYCIEDICTHDGQPLADGPMVGCEITCPRHGARFDVRDGKATCMPATEPVATYPVEVRDGAVFVGTSD